MKGNIKKVERRVMVYCILLMVPNILGFSLIMKFMVMVYMNGLMVEYIRVIGNKIK
jgi:hypothetical protein